MLNRLFLNLKIASQSSFCTFSSKASSYHRLPSGYNPPTPYALYIKDNIKKGTSFKDSAKTFAESWKNLNQHIKDEYKKKAIEIGIERELEFKKLTEIEKQNAIKADSELKKKRFMRLRRKIFHEFNQQTNRPQRPLNLFAVFISEKMKNFSGSLAERKDAFSKAAIEWKSLSKIDKEKYEVIANKQKKVYLNSLDEWKNKVFFTDNEKTKILLRKYKKL